MIPRTIPKSSYIAKVVVKSTPDIPDVGDLPLVVVSWAGLPPDGCIGPGKSAKRSLGLSLTVHIQEKLL